VASDTIGIDAGLYRRDVCVVQPNSLTLRGVNGRAHLEAADASAQGKAIWVIKGNDVVVENIEFSGASVLDQNGAAFASRDRTSWPAIATFTTILRQSGWYDRE